MQELTEADAQEIVQDFRRLKEKLKGNSEFAKEVLGWIELRPKKGLSPNERYENLIESFGHVKTENALSK